MPSYPSGIENYESPMRNIVSGITGIHYILVDN